EEGSFQGAADRLLKSQSTVSYAIAQLQDKLGVPLFKYEGRRARLTETGELVLRRAGQLVDQANRLEQVATDLARGWEPQINIVADAIFPREIVLRALERFAPLSGGARVELYTETLSGTHELLINRAVSLGICGLLPTGFLGEALLEVRMLAVAHPEHALFAPGSPIDEATLASHRQLVVRDSGSYRRLSSGWLSAEQRWTVANFEESRDLVKRGLGFAFLPTHLIEEELATGALRELPLSHGGERSVMSSLVYTDRENAGPGTRALAEIIEEESRRAS
ncbi:MAG: LysR family transcriptional regulator, partial [Halioglobus sp.]|nr:LysR family transcriptional regulator [Halioglobus sp.]